MKCGFELRESLTICTSDMLACVLQGMTKRTRKARFLAGVLLARRMVQFLALDEYTPGAVFPLSQLNPGFKDYLIGQIRANKNTVSMEIGVVFLLLRIPPAELVTPERKKLARGDPQLRHHPPNAGPHILIEFADVFRKWHPAKIHGSEIQGGNDVSRAETWAHEQSFDNRPQAHVLTEEIRKNCSTTVATVTHATIEFAEETMLFRMIATIQASAGHPTICKTVCFPQ